MKKTAKVEFPSRLKRRKSDFFTQLRVKNGNLTAVLYRTTRKAETCSRSVPGPKEKPAETSWTFYVHPSLPGFLSPVNDSNLTTASGYRACPCHSSAAPTLLPGPGMSYMLSSFLLAAHDGLAILHHKAQIPFTPCAGNSIALSSLCIKTQPRAADRAMNLILTCRDSFDP